MKLEEALKSTRFADEKHKAILNTLYSAYWLKTHLSAATKENGITIEQFNILRILKGKFPEQMCVKDIGSRLIEKNSNVPRIIDRLLIKKLVKRNPSLVDKRETLISLTDRGLALLEAANTTMMVKSESIIGLNEEESKQLNELLEKMRLVD